MNVLYKYMGLAEEGLQLYVKQFILVLFINYCIICVYYFINYCNISITTVNLLLLASYIYIL